MSLRQQNTNKMELEQKTQLQKANEVLVEELYKNVTSLDRRAAIAELDVSMFTVVQYLKGRGKDTDTATRLIDFFRRRISKRDVKIG